LFVIANLSLKKIIIVIHNIRNWLDMSLGLNLLS
jgi:hypothetical protein